jgi:tetratricopeptide (TPR) repeat protein
MEKLDRAEQFLKQGNYRQAIALYEEVQRACPEEESVLLMLAWAHYDNGDNTQAKAYLEKLLTRELSRKVFTGFAFDELVRIYKEEKDFEKLIEICATALAAQPDDIGLLAELGNAYLLAGKAADACGIYKKLIALENDNPSFYCLLGEALFAAGSTRESEAAFGQAAAIDPDQSDSYYYKISALFARSGRHREARALLEKCIALNPAKPLYYCSLGDVLIGLGEVKKALVAYETAAQKDHSSAGAYFNRLGNTFMKEKLFERAADAFRKSIEYEALLPYYRNLAAAYELMGKPGLAEETRQRAGRIKKDD